MKKLRKECEAFEVNFCFIETGTFFIKDEKTYHLPNKRLQSRMAFKSKMNYIGKSIDFKLCDSWGLEIPQTELYKPHYRTNCKDCASRQICNGCSDCGKCGD